MSSSSCGHVGEARRGCAMPFSSSLCERQVEGNRPTPKPEGFGLDLLFEKTFCLKKL